jgi:hypothetical protein
MRVRELDLWRKVVIVVAVIVGVVWFKANGGVLLGDPCPPWC